MMMMMTIMIVIILKHRHAVPLLISLYISVPGSWQSPFTLYNY